MSSNKTATRPTLSHDATKTNKSTNIINNVTNTISSDRALTPVNDGQKKKVERGTHKHKRSEVVAHKAMVNHCYPFL